MESKKRFDKINQIEKVFFKLSIITICAIVGNIISVVVLLFYGSTAITSEFWVVINMLFVLIAIGILFTKLKLNHQNFIAYGFVVFLFFPLLWYVFPIKITQDYIGLRKTDDTGLIVNEGFILVDEYCKNNCNINEILIRQGYKKERKFYSWKYAELLGRYPSDDLCCYNLPFDNMFLFGLFLLLEITFEYFPLILFLTILFSLVEYIRRKELDAFWKGFISTEEFDIRKINLVVFVIIIIVLFYNFRYMNLI
jgi:hypothetical protein